jgi:uncharacterized membrane protein YkoI
MVALVVLRNKAIKRGRSSPETIVLLGSIATGKYVETLLPVFRESLLFPGEITKSRAELIALSKVHGGTIRSAELETSRGQRFWSVYIVQARSKNAKEIRVDAISGRILTVQTERPADQAEEPRQTH